MIVPPLTVMLPLPSMPSPMGWTSAALSPLNPLPPTVRVMSPPPIKSWPPHLSASLLSFVLGVFHFKSQASSSATGCEQPPAKAAVVPQELMGSEGVQSSVYPVPALGHLTEEPSSLTRLRALPISGLTVTAEGQAFASGRIPLPATYTDTPRWPMLKHQTQLRDTQPPALPR